MSKLQLGLLRLLPKPLREVVRNGYLRQPAQKPRIPSQAEELVPSMKSAAPHGRVSTST
jgi:hypothetical protein